MNALRHVLPVLLLSLVISTQADASGFTIYEYGAEQQAQGGAVAAQVSSPSAIFYNPAGLIGLERTRPQVGTSVLFPRLTFRSNTTNTETKRDLGPVFPTYFFASHDFAGRLGIGFGFYSAAANKVDYPKDWEGRYFLTEAELRQFNFAPTVAYRVSDRVSVGISGVLTLADFEQTSQINLTPFGFTEGTSKLKGDGLGLNAVVGLKARLAPALQLGVVYKSPMKITMEGDAGFQVPAAVKPLFPDGGIKTDQEFPQMVIVGLAGHPIPNLTLEADLQWTNWDTFNSQNIRFDNKTIVVQDTVVPHNWRNTWTVRTGGEYSFNDFVTMRGGYVYDPSAVPDETLSPLIPELDKHMVTVGLGLHNHRWSVDLLYEAIIGESRRVNNALPNYPVHSGEYSSTAHAAGVSIHYRF